MGDEGGDEEMNPAEAQQRLGAMREMCQQMAMKINELDMDQKLTQILPQKRPKMDLKFQFELSHQS